MMSPQRGFTRRGDGWWSGRSRGSSSAAAFALAGRRRPKTGWRLFSLPAPTSCSIWRFSDRVLANLRAALAAGGAKPEHIIKWNVYIVEGQSLQAGFAAFQNAWPETPNAPAITGVFVSGLAHPDFLVEMDAVAVVPQ